MIANKEVEDAYHLPYTHRWAYNIMQRKENIAANAKAARAAGISIRKCSYCGTAGHARNKCESLASDKAGLLAYEKRYRSAFAAWLPNSGIGVGAMLVAINRINDDGNPHTVMVIRVGNFDNYNAITPEGGRNSGENIIGNYLNREGWENYPANFSIPHGCNFPNTDGRYGFSVAAPSSIPAVVPDTYLSDEVIKKFVDETFDEKRTRSTRYRSSTEHFGVFNSNRPNLETIKNGVEAMEKAADEAYKSKHAAA